VSQPPLVLYNTRTRRKEPFAPPDGTVRLYVCGVTPYDTTHLGHARTYLTFDLLVRYLRCRGFPVRYVQNVTDIDDSILQRARKVGTPWDELGRHWFAVYRRDMDALNILPADNYPPATGEIAGIQRITGRLIASGHAYATPVGVFYRVGHAAGYGALSGLDRAQMIEITAKQDDADLDNPHKEDPLDFALWKPSAEDEPRWPSPWGPGRPGWHIECSAIALDHLGPSFDIHGGGQDLIFPHHESEIAQSEAYTGVHPFARFWMHTGMANLDGVKMSKSLGNMIFARDLLQQYSADAIRLYLMAHHYRDPLDYNEADLRRAQALADRLSALDPDRGPTPTTEAAIARFHTRMSDHLNTPAILAILEEMSADPNGAAALAEIGSTLGLRLQRA
jgi:L-cysteine:1D-myo-inositol 2-amino-2-deoxy-alpha-D-glucopyranoside ligase